MVDQAPSSEHPARWAHREPSKPAFCAGGYRWSREWTHILEPGPWVFGTTWERACPPTYICISVSSFCLQPGHFITSALPTVDVESVWMSPVKGQLGVHHSAAQGRGDTWRGPAGHCWNIIIAPRSLAF